MKTAAITCILVLVTLMISGCDPVRDLSKKELESYTTYIVESFDDDQIWDDDVLFMCNGEMYFRTDGEFEDGKEAIEIIYQDLMAEFLTILDENDIVNNADGLYVYREFYFMVSDINESPSGIHSLQIRLLKNDSFLIEFYDATRDEPMYGLIFKLEMESLYDNDYGSEYNPDNWTN